MENMKLLKKILHLLIALTLIIFLSCSFYEENHNAKRTKVEKTDSAPKTTLINPRDSAEMVLVPRGEFIMGAEDENIAGRDKLGNNDSRENEKPAHRVYLDDFYIYKFEVTNDQFRKFVDATGYQTEGNWERWTNYATGSYPVVMVSWNDAAAYCKWAGVKLPSEAQWEKAARGVDGRRYPWGNTWDASLCNNKETPIEKLEGKVLPLLGHTGIMPVGSFPDGKSPYGAMDMVGNVGEWVNDWYEDDYYKKSPAKNPRGPSKGEDKVIRGGSYFQEISTCRTTYREDNFPSGNDNYIGFRCVWEPGMPFPSAFSSPFVPKNPSSIIRSPYYSRAPEKRDATPILLKNSPIILQRGNKIINSRDGAELILIPAGEFVMGAAKHDPDASWEEKPAHKVHLKKYYIYKYEVTFQQFARFERETGYKSKGKWKNYYNKTTKNHPVFYVTWDDAVKYCEWAGAKLPTEAQWEYAARGKDARIFPWGNEWNANWLNNFELSDNSLKAKRFIVYDNMGTTPVGIFPNDKSPFGVMDMGGNVIEWCRDWYDPEYYKKSPKDDPEGPPTGSQKVMRGGGWGQPRQVCRASYRSKERPHDVDGDFGFRCVLEIEGEIKDLSN